MTPSKTLSPELKCPTCGAKRPDAMTFCSDGFHAPGETYWPCTHCNGTGNANTRPPIPGTGQGAGA
jgi:hypothetical protein